MAQSLAANLTAFNKQLQTGLIEAAAEQFQLFNAISNGALVLRDGAILGNFQEYGFWTRAMTVARRDVTSSSARTLSGHVMSEYKGVKLSRSINDDQTVSALKSQGIDINAFAKDMSRSIVEDIILDAFTTAITGLVGTLTKQASTYNNVSALSATLYGISLNNCWDTMQLMGDRSMEIKAILMHSYEATALKKALSASTSVGLTLGAGIVRDDVLTGHFMRPVFVTDNAYLKVNKTSASGAYDTYRTFFLTQNAAIVTKMETVQTMAYEDRSYANTTLSITGEHELELQVKGFSYTNSGVNPTASTVATASNWTLVSTSIKDGAGAVLITR